MAFVPSGEYVMGSPQGEEGRLDNETQHHVTLTHDFYIGVTEVTQAQFEDRMGYNPSSSGKDCPNCPVENIHWDEAAAFTNAMSSDAGLEPCYDCSGSGGSVICSAAAFDTDSYGCPGYRLPFEAEWEYAARAGASSAYQNGGNLLDGDGSDCSGELELDKGELLDDIARYCGNAESAEPVAQLEPNNWGLYDVSGNVGEWCHESWDGEDYPEGDVVDPIGDASGGGSH